MQFKIVPFLFGLDVGLILVLLAFVLLHVEFAG